MDGPQLQSLVKTAEKIERAEKKNTVTIVKIVIWQH